MLDIDKLRALLKVANEEYDSATKVCQNPHARSEDFGNRLYLSGVCTGLAKAIEKLTETK